MDFEAFILNIVNSITEANYNTIGAVVIVIGLVFWIVVSSWIWIDADERTTSKWMRIFYLVIGIVPVLGWIIYLIIRPPETIDEIYWGDLERRYLKYEAKDLGDCPKCGTQLYPGYVYCPNCGERIKRKCSSCGMYVDLEYKYCPYCGKQMAKRSQQEKEISQEEMQKQIEETKDEVHETVKSKKSKYKQEQNFIRRVEESVVEGYKLLNKKIKGVFNKPKVNEKDKESSKKGNGNKK
jgi:uncharacterized Zn finger protein (UPF0148 family)